MSAYKTDEYGCSALHYVVVDLPVEQHASEIKRLIGQGVDPNEADKQGWTPLHFAAQRRSPDAAKVLLDHGVTVDLQDQYGNTPLLRAVFESKGEGEMIALLLACGADPDLANTHDVSPRSLANTIANHDVARWFK